MARWILQCNPERYGLRDALRDGFGVRRWTVARYLRDIALGDEVAMWVSGPGAGVCVLGEVTSGAERSAEEPVLTREQRSSRAIGRASNPDVRGVN
jgi:EVE domain